MDEEMQSLKDNNSYELAYIPEGQKVIGSRQVYALKPVADGEKFKARFVAKGFTQEKDVDYEETFAPTAKMTTLRAFIQVAARQKLRVQQMDVKTAYLNAPIDHDIYIHQPKGYEVKNKDGKVLYCKLKKSLYGLKQSGRMWNNVIHNFFISENLNQSHADHCMLKKMARIC